MGQSCSNLPWIDGLRGERSPQRAELYNDRPVLGVAFCDELQRAMPVAHGLRRARVTPGGAGVTRRSMLAAERAGLTRERIRGRR
jgi:hypothetical protein